MTTGYVTTAEPRTSSTPHSETSAAHSMRSREIGRLLASYTLTQTAGKATILAYCQAVESFTPHVVGRAVDDWLHDNPGDPPQAPQLAERCRRMVQEEHERKALEPPRRPTREGLLEAANNLERRALAVYSKLPPNIVREVDAMREKAGEL